MENQGSEANEWLLDGIEFETRFDEVTQYKLSKTRYERKPSDIFIQDPDVKSIKAFFPILFISSRDHLELWSIEKSMYIDPSAPHEGLRRELCDAGGVSHIQLSRSRIQCISAYLFLDQDLQRHLILDGDRDGGYDELSFLRLMERYNILKAYCEHVIDSNAMRDNEIVPDRRLYMDYSKRRQDVLGQYRVLSVYATIAGAYGFDTSSKYARVMAYLRAKDLSGERMSYESLAQMLKQLEDGYI